MTGGERFNTATHSLGAVLTTIGMLFLVVAPLVHGEYLKAFGFAVYGISLFFAYLTSALFHFVRDEAKDIYRRYDRIAIYLLIAGTYTPIALLKLPSSWGIPVLVVIWLTAVSGASAETLVARKKKPLSVTLYVLMGWMMLLVIKPLLVSLTVQGVALLLGGGVLYTLGAILLRLKLHPRCHEIWHVVVLVASACHFAVMLFYVS